jgi:hypothetical protein
MSLLSKGAAVRGIAVGSAHSPLCSDVASDRHQIRPPIERRFRFDDVKATLVMVSKFIN